ncbi:MAG TPA: hypothetical protein VG897_18005 [Terriglobales bacterium]|nr:hypothetical protein [Terriglobales bacterium]
MSNVIYGALAAALILGAGSGAYYLAHDSGQRAVLGDDLCRSDQPLAAHSITLLDSSDALSSEEQEIVRDAVDADAAAASPYEKVSVLAVEASQPYAPNRLFSACAPKRGADAQGVSENPALYEAIWKHRFRGPLDKAIAGELASSSQDASPLVETIWAVSRLPDFGPAIGRRRLDIVSDMLQLSAGYSQYHSHLSYARYARTEFGRLRVPNLRGVHVVIHYLMRPKTLDLQTSAHVRFWEDFFRAAGASKVDVVGGPAS